MTVNFMLIQYTCFIRVFQGLQEAIGRLQGGYRGLQGLYRGQNGLYRGSIGAKRGSKNPEKEGIVVSLSSVGKWPFWGVCNSLIRAAQIGAKSDIPSPPWFRPGALFTPLFLPPFWAISGFWEGYRGGYPYKPPKWPQNDPIGQMEGINAPIQR